MKRMNNLKNVIAARIMGGLVIGMTAVAGVAPVTVFAQSQEAECICEEKCHCLQAVRTVPAVPVINCRMQHH